MDYLTEDVLEQPARDKGSVKGDNGKVLIVAGSQDYAGAATLTSLACESVLRSGADIAMACCPEKVGWLINNKLPDAITRKFEGKQFSEQHSHSIIRMAEDFDVLLVGPGLSRKAIPFAKEVVESVGIPKVIDADAIHAASLKKAKNSVFTPHEKEFKALLNNSGLTEKNYEDYLGSNVLLLKGREDRIISEEKEALNRTGNSVMTKGGTGDVLAGLCAGFIAQGNNLFKAACMAAYLNGAVGDLLEEERGKTFIASDIVKNVHRVYH